VGVGVLPPDELGLAAPWATAALIAVEICEGAAVVLPWLITFIRAVATGLAWLGALLVTAEASIVAVCVTAAALWPVLFWTYVCITLPAMAPAWVGAPIVAAAATVAAVTAEF